MAATSPRRLRDHTSVHKPPPGRKDQSRSLSTHVPGSGEGRFPHHAQHQPASRERDEDLSAISKHAHTHCSVPLPPVPFGTAPNTHPDRNSTLHPPSASWRAPEDCTADTEAISARFPHAPLRPRQIRMGMEKFRSRFSRPESLIISHFHQDTPSRTRILKFKDSAVITHRATVITRVVSKSGKSTYAVHV